MNRTLTFLATALAVSLCITCGMAAASIDPGDASLVIVHGIPGADLGLDPELPVDVKANGVCLLSDFRFGEIVGPVIVQAGTYNIQIGLADPVTPCSSAPVIDATFTFEPGEHASVIAHLTEDGLPTASKFINLVSRPFRNKARVILHHTAAAPAVDITARRGQSRVRMAVRGVVNGQQPRRMLLPGNWNFSIMPSGTETSLFYETIQLKPRSIHLMYAVGSPASGTFTVLRTTLPYLMVETPSVIVVHGIPGIDLGLDPDLAVDVSVDGACTLSGFTFGAIAGPIPLTEGLHHVSISAASPAVPCGELPLLEADIMIGPSENATLIAHLTAEGTPTVSRFTNDVSRTPPGRTRIVVQHLAAAPAVDMKAQRPWDGPVGFRAMDLENGDKASGLIRPGDWEISVAPAGTHMPLIDAMTTLKPYTAHLIYAVGSVDNGTLDLLMKRVP